MLNRLKSFFIFTGLFFALNPLPTSASLLFSQSSALVRTEAPVISNPVKNSMWYICKKKGNNAGDIVRGPFESREAAFANWYYYSASSKKECISENLNFITSDPEADYPKEFEAVKKELEENHAQALKKYSIKPNEKIEKNYIKRTKSLAPQSKIFEIDLFSIQKKILFENKTTADYTASLEINLGKKISINAGDTVVLKWKGKFDIFIPKLSLNFNSRTDVLGENIPEDEIFEGYQVYVIEEKLPATIRIELFYPDFVGESAQFTLLKRSDRVDLSKAEETAEEVKEVEEEKAAAGEAGLAAENKENTENTENAENSETDFSFVPSAIEAADSSVKRYKREYLQDFALPETTEIPLTLSGSSAAKEEKKLIANPNLKDKDGRTDLMKACALGNEWQVKNLLESGAKVNLKDKDGWTALMYAVRYSESLATVNLLLDANADVKLLNNYSSSALLIAVSFNNNPQILTRLMDYYNSSDKELLKALVFLLSSNSSTDYIIKEKIKLFIDKEIPLNTFYNGKTPLMYAAQYSASTEVIKLLLDNDAVKTIRSVEGKTVFDYAKDNSKLRHDDIYWSLNSQR